jgi:ubiquinone/menaquinone biosynthesis C-methylase UbiE
MGIRRMAHITPHVSKEPVKMNKQEQWQVAGNASEVYERELVPAIFGPWAPILVELTHPRQGDHVLDVACGTGIVARNAAARVGTSGAVAGVDLNPGMLRAAQTSWSKSPHSHVPIQWHEASAEKLPFPDASFDVVCCQLGLQFFTDRPAALREMHRVLDAEGRLALMVWRGIDESPGFAALAESLDRHIGHAAAAVMRAPFGLSDADELSALVKGAGFHDVAVQKRVGTVRFASIDKLVLSYVAGSPLASQVSQAGEACALLISDLTKALAHLKTGKELAFPIGAHLLSARV